MNEEVKKIIEESTNLHITEAFLKADNVLSRPIYHNIMCSISGGSDSDIMIDMIEKIKPKGKVHYVFFDTGLEYDATKRHLDYLEEKYNIQSYEYNKRYRKIFRETKVTRRKNGMIPGLKEMCEGKEE